MHDWCSWKEAIQHIRLFFKCIYCLKEVGCVCLCVGIFKKQTNNLLSLRTHLRVVLLKKIRGLGNHLEVAVSCLCPRFNLISFDCAQKATQAVELWAKIMERNLHCVIIFISARSDSRRCFIDNVIGISSIRVGSLVIMQMWYRLLEVFSRLVSEDAGICWADGRSSGVALTPDPPTDVPKASQSSVTKQWKISNTPEQTSEYPGQLGAFERHFSLRSGARCSD